MEDLNSAALRSATALYLHLGHELREQPSTRTIVAVEPVVVENLDRKELGKVRGRLDNEKCHL